MAESPKARFLKNKDLAARWAAIAASSDFEEVCDAAILQLIENQSTSLEGASAIASHYMLSGAKNFRQMLSHLSQAAVKTERQPLGELTR